jgi:D-alanyl-D-alanine endopeptidase (penicillin-binding protein 7)
MLVYVILQLSLLLNWQWQSLPYLNLAPKDFFQTVSEQKIVEANKIINPVIAPKKVPNQSLGIKTDAVSTIVVDKQSNKILFAHNAEEVRSVASLTKLISALVFLDTNPDWTKTVTYDIDDMEDGAQLGIFMGEEANLKDVFMMTLMASANDGINLLVKMSGLSRGDFVYRMNKKAKDLGMSNTNFVEPTGLDARNQSTAADLVYLARSAFNQPLIREATTSKRYSFTTINSNRLVSKKNTDKLVGGFLDIKAGKTGYTDEAGNNLILEVQDKGKHPIIVVVLGASSGEARFQDAKALSVWTFENYEWQ